MIYVECDNDARLLRYLNYTYSDDYKHPGGKGNVLKSLKNSNISLGLVDEDPFSKNPYPQLNDFIETQNIHNLRLLNHNNIMTRKLIILPNEIEKWWIRLAELENIKLSDYSVVDRFGNFKKHFSEKDEHLLFEFLAAVSSNPGSFN